jgi:hypothetical protein
MYFEWGRADTDAQGSHCEGYDLWAPRADGAEKRCTETFGNRRQDGGHDTHCQMRQGICLRAEARIGSEDVNRGSCSAPVWLRWRADQELRGGEPFDDAHGAAADRAFPE